LTGDGSNPNWEKAPFEPLEIREGGTLDFSTRVKLLYSDTGIYILMEAADSLLTATLTNDYEHLWTEDVFEAFFWTDEAHTVYFEYEISPLGYELPLLIPNLDGHYLGWIPWEYEGGRKIRKALSTIGGPQESGARIEGWRAEIFVPYALLNPLQNVPPTPGSHWRANFYRNDYDAGDPTRWEWSPTGASYHEIAQYGVLNFQ
jgi:hypothetical protein